jgi:hypothetical protein
MICSVLMLALIIGFIGFVNGKSVAASNVEDVKPFKIIKNKAY